MQPFKQNRFSKIVSKVYNGKPYDHFKSYFKGDIDPKTKQEIESIEGMISSNKHNIKDDSRSDREISRTVNFNNNIDKIVQRGESMTNLYGMLAILSFVSILALYYNFDRLERLLMINDELKNRLDDIERDLNVLKSITRYIRSFFIRSSNDDTD